MATFVSKFNINDTAYIINDHTLNLDSVVITDIHIRQSINLPTGISSYMVSYRGRTSISQKDFDETELFYLDEAKTGLGILIAQRTSDVGSIR